MNSTVLKGYGENDLKNLEEVLISVVESLEKARRITRNEVPENLLPDEKNIRLAVMSNQIDSFYKLVMDIRDEIESRKVDRVGPVVKALEEIEKIAFKPITYAMLMATAIGKQGNGISGLRQPLTGERWIQVRMAPAEDGTSHVVLKTEVLYADGGYATAHRNFNIATMRYSDYHEAVCLMLLNFVESERERLRLNGRKGIVFYDFAPGTRLYVSGTPWTVEAPSYAMARP